MGYTYHYDQLNRLKKLRQHSGIISWSSSNVNSGYKENFTYDGNGNILTLLRSGATSTVTDSLTYKYNRDVNGRLTDNKLNYLHGTGAATNFGPPQSANNYTYDPIGNLTKDVQSHLGKVAWSVYGKIDTIERGSDTTIIYRYNTTQERISKTLTTTSGSLTTYYLRDAQGNTIALYDNKASAINWREQHLYGSSRLGMWQPNINLATGGASTKWDTAGYKLYELNNHLGNVLATITDKRIAHAGYYTPDITTAQDYYGFGALMPGRQFKTDSNYRYGFNGKENDNEVKGTGNEQDYGMRIYDPRVGRFLSVDPLQPKYAELSSYQYASNRPIDAIDLNGQEAISCILIYNKDGSATIKKTSQHDIVENTYSWSWSDFSFQKHKHVNESLLITLTHPTRGTFQFYNYGQLTTFLKDPEHSDQSHEEGKLLQTEAVTADFAIPGSIVLSEVERLEEGLLFRGTSEGFAGSSAVQKLGITPATTDPLVSTVFATASEESGQGIVLIATKSDLMGIHLEGGNVLQKIEKEVAVKLRPLDFAQKASIKITANQARTILKGMGITVPRKISVSDISNTLKDLPKLTDKQIRTFYEEAAKLVKPD